MDILSKGASVRVMKALMASLVIVVLMGFFVPALAAPGSGDEPPEVQPNVISRTNDPEVLGTDDAVLPFTGGQIVLFVLIGVGAVGAGTLVLRSVGSRRGSVDPA
jgi:hypothetical protein